MDDPNNPESNPLNESSVFQAQAELLQGEHRWEDLVELLLNHAGDAVAPERRVELLRRAAGIFGEKLGEQGHAILVLLEAFKLDPGDQQTLHALEQAGSATGRWTDLLAACSEALEQLSAPGDKAALLTCMGRWYHVELGHEEYATEALKQALALEPGNITAMGMLGNLHRQAARWTELFALLERQAAVEPDAHKRAELLMEMGKLCENRLYEEDLAVRSYEQVLELDGGHAGALTALQRLHRQAGRWLQLAEVLERRARSSSTIGDATGIWLQAAELFEQQLGDIQGAIGCYQEVLALDPGNTPAARMLELLLERAGEKSSVLELLHRELEQSEDPQRQVDLLMRLGAEHEGRPDELDLAVECFQRALELIPRHGPSLDALQRIYRREERFTDLADLLTRTLEDATEDGERVDLLLRLAALHEESLHDPERAMEHYETALELAPDNPHALDALAVLYEQVEDFDRAAMALRRLLEALPEAAHKAAVHFRLGVIREYIAEDLAGAEEHYQQALALEPGHRDAVLRMVELTRGRGDWGKAARLMERAAELQAEATEGARLLFEAAEACLDHLEDEPRGEALLRRCLALAPGHLGAGQRLADILGRQERVEELEPMLQGLLQHDGGQDPPFTRELTWRLAVIRDDRGKPWEAISGYRAVLGMDAGHAPSLMRLGKLLYKMEEFQEAMAVHRTILDQHLDSLPPGQAAEVCYRQGVMELQRGERGEALGLLEAAVGYDEGHLAAAEAIVAVKGGQQDWHGVLLAKQRLLEGSSGQERARLLQECAEICHGDLGDLHQAEAFLVEALAISPENPHLLHGLLDLYQEQDRWEEAVEVLVRLAGAEQAPALKAKYHHAAGVILRDSLLDLERAVESFNRALDADETEIRAMEAIERLGQEQQDWALLNKSYRKMLKRLTDRGGSRELQASLWNRLGQLNLNQLDRPEDAVLALEVAARLEPENRQRHELLGELYGSMGPSYLGKAVATYQLLLATDPTRSETARTLRRLYAGAGQLDKAWCMSAALVFAGHAEGEDQQPFLAHEPDQSRARSRITEDMWQRRINHPDQDQAVSSVLALLAPVLGSATARPAKALGLRPKEQLDPRMDPSTLCRLFTFATSVLGVTEAALFRRPDEPVGLELIHTAPVPSFLAGAHMEDLSETELLFALGEKLTLLRPEHYLRKVLGSAARLKTAIFAAIRSVQPGFKVPPGDLPAVEQVLELLAGNLHPGQLEQLASVVGALAAAGSELNLNRWWRGAELTAGRVGIILCNDLRVASRRPGSVDSISATGQSERVRDLLAFATSEDYFKVRRDLGMALALT